MKKDHNKNQPKPLGDFFAKYNLMIFVVIVIVGLAAAVLDLNYILQLPYNATDNAESSSNAFIFDQTTITNLEKLKTSSENTSSQTLPSGRINPFSE